MPDCTAKQKDERGVYLDDDDAAFWAERDLWTIKEAVCLCTGYAPEDLLGRDPELTQDKDLHEALQTAERSIVAGTLIAVEWRGEHASHPADFTRWSLRYQRWFDGVLLMNDAFRSLVCSPYEIKLLAQESAYWKEHPWTESEPPTWPCEFLPSREVESRLIAGGEPYVVRLQGNRMMDGWRYRTDHYVHILGGCKYQDWMKRDTWTLEEACCLFCGYDPALFAWHGVDAIRDFKLLIGPMTETMAYRSLIACKARVRDEAIRAVTAGTLVLLPGAPVPSVLPRDFVQWTRQNFDRLIHNIDGCRDCITFPELWPLLGITKDERKEPSTDLYPNAAPDTAKHETPQEQADTVEAKKPAPDEDGYTLTVTDAANRLIAQEYRINAKNLKLGTARGEISKACFPQRHIDYAGDGPNRRISERSLEKWLFARRDRGLDNSSQVATLVQENVELLKDNEALRRKVKQ